VVDFDVCDLVEFDDEDVDFVVGYYCLSEVVDVGCDVL